MKLKRPKTKQIYKMQVIWQGKTRWRGLQDSQSIKVYTGETGRPVQVKEHDRDIRLRYNNINRDSRQEITQAWMPKIAKTH